MYILTKEKIAAFGAMLQEDERAPGTIGKYLRDIRAFSAWLGGRAVTKELTAGWKAHLRESGYAPVTINSMLSALNRFLSFAGWDNFRVKFLRIQRRLFREQTRELTRGDYQRLLTTARALGKGRLELLMETICATGIRVSEVRYITVEAAQKGRTEIHMKGKVRVILLPGKLCRKLLKYAKKKKIVAGEIFLTSSGKGVSRRQIWHEMKKLCSAAGVEATKVFPHNLRHLFATAFYQACRDIVKLADVLGHSSIETTRIYLVTTGEEHARQLERLRLVN